jgi:myo-inositol 2-dehydrogenase / D-chiro-inositol 1-dehydrogenase
VSVRVGIVGVGVMGADHARVLASHVPGAVLQAVYDADAARAKAVADQTGARTVADDALALIREPTIDAVLIASPDATHKALTLACIEARKPVLCEKPLAPTATECLEVIAAEKKLGRQLVQVGYMRRFDPAYVEMKTTMAEGRLGAPLMFHCVHRNVSAPSWFDSRMAVSNSAVHEFDAARWMLGSELTAIQVFRPKTARAASPGAPVFIVLETAQGQLVDIEIFIDATYGYDVRAELVCEKGTISLSAANRTEVNLDLGHGGAYPADWRPRFADAYRIQAQAWIGSIGRQTPRGAGVWDGYAAAAVAEAGLQSLAENRSVPISLVEKPALYRSM